ncbi:MAG TPA: hypothetical protein VHB47_06360 [Thermoanaerobaculia bacterium]|jgi:hypothetical protein|nr:hypothetical protein [Thermoanaerobaculia bacterium]
MDRGLPAGTGACQLVVDSRRSFLYVLDPEHGIFRWLPEAQGWTMAEDGLPPRFQESSSYLFAIDPTRSDVLYAGGQYGLLQLTVPEGAGRPAKGGSCEAISGACCNQLAAPP